MVRGRILAAFEAAEAEPDPDERAAWLTFVVVGGGPTGVEMAGQIGELARDTLRARLPHDRHAHGRILLIEAADRLLTSFPPSLSAKALRSLERLGVTPMLDSTVVGVEAGCGDRCRSLPVVEPERIPTRTIIWAAGVTASALAATLGELTGAELDRAGRVDGRAGPDAARPPRGVRARRHGPRAPGATAPWRRCPASRRSPCSRAATRPR